MSSPLHKLFSRNRGKAPAIEAKVEALGAMSGRYKIKLRDGTVINNVPGAVGLRIGQSVAAVRYEGGRMVIVASSYTNTKPIKTVNV